MLTRSVTDDSGDPEIALDPKTYHYRANTNDNQPTATKEKHCLNQ